MAALEFDSGAKVSTRVQYFFHGEAVRAIMARREQFRLVPLTSSHRPWVSRLAAW